MAFEANRELPGYISIQNKSKQGYRVCLMTGLHIDKISGGYGDLAILDAVSLHVEPDEIVVIAGPNGAGKSTALKSVFGLINITSGRVIFDHDDITGLSPDQVASHGVGFVPQVKNVFPSLSVEENLHLGAFLRKDDYSSTLDSVYDLFPDLAEKRRQSAGTLSGGQRQMVAMGRALMLAPRLLLLDEPTAGLSPKFMEQIFSIVRDINRQGIGILMVEQNARQALAIADRAYILVTGRNRFEGTGREILADRQVREMFLGG